MPGWQNLALHEEVIKVRGHEDRLLRCAARVTAHHQTPAPGTPWTAEIACAPPCQPVLETFLIRTTTRPSAFLWAYPAANMAEFEAVGLHCTARPA